MEISERNIKEECRRLEREVKRCKSRILDELVDYKYAIADLRDALKAYKSACSRYKKKPVERKREAMNIAFSELEGEYTATLAVKERIISYLDTAAETTAEHRDLLGTNDRAGMTLADKFERYSKGVTSRLASLERGVMNNIPSELTQERDVTEDSEENYAESVARDIEELRNPVPNAQENGKGREEMICDKLADLLKTAEKLVAELSEISNTYAELSHELEEIVPECEEQIADIVEPPQDNESADVEAVSECSDSTQGNEHVDVEAVSACSDQAQTEAVSLE